MYKKIIFIITFIFFSCSNNDSNSSSDSNFSFNCEGFETLELSTFSLIDLNPNSESYQQSITPETFSDITKLFYFTNKET